MPGTAFPTIDDEFDAVYDDFGGELDLGALFAGLFGGAVSSHPEHPAGHRVFDWKKAAQRIKETGAQEASAGLAEDWGYTGGPILENGEIVHEDDTYTFLQSYWATPVLRIDGREEECWTLAEESEYDAVTYWPADARAVLGS